MCTVGLTLHTPGFTALHPRVHCTHPGVHCTPYRVHCTHPGFTVRTQAFTVCTPGFTVRTPGFTAPLVAAVLSQSDGGVCSLTLLSYGRPGVEYLGVLEPRASITHIFTFGKLVSVGGVMRSWQAGACSASSGTAPCNRGGGVVLCVTACIHGCVGGLW